MWIKYLSDTGVWVINHQTFDRKKCVEMLNSGNAKALMNLSVHGFIEA